MDDELDPYLEQQYNNRAAVPDFANYLKSWQQRSAEFRSMDATQTNAYLNIPYGDSLRQLVDIFPPDRNAKAPVHIFIHGGYWQALDKDSFSFLAKKFNEHGECAVIVNYDLCPAVSVADITVQIKQLMLWVMSHIQNYGGDPATIKVTGHSAGAHLLATLLTTDWSEWGLQDYPFQQLNALSGLYDLQPLMSTSVNRALRLDVQTAVQNSPLFNKVWMPVNKPQLNLWVGELESQQYKKQSEYLAEKWRLKLKIQYFEALQTHHFSILDYFLVYID